MTKKTQVIARFFLTNNQITNLSSIKIIELRLMAMESGGFSLKMILRRLAMKIVMHLFGITIS